MLYLGKGFFIMRQFMACVALILATCTGIHAQNSLDAFDFRLDHKDGQYALGDTVRLSMTPPQDACAALRMTTYINGINTGDTVDVVPARNSECIYKAAWDEPAAVMLEFTRKGASADGDKFTIGYIVGADQFKTGWEAPKDLHKFWKRQIKELRKVPMEVKLKPVALKPEDAQKYECFEVEINSIDTIPVRGYITRPKDAPRKSLPIVVQLHAAGVAGNWCKATVDGALHYTRMGAIAIDFNAHGMFNDAPDSYFQELENGRLKGYSSQIITDHESYYFRTMFLRAVRALDYITEDPAWDGKRLMVTGESQGGAQSAALVGIYKKVSDAAMFVPAMIGTGGMVQGRLSAWPKPLEKNGLDSPAMKVAPYYDGALLIKGSKANLFVEIGLIDVTCPPAEIFSGLNGAKGRKVIETSPYRPHHCKMADRYMVDWKERVYKSRMDYIEEFMNRK